MPSSVVAEIGNPPAQFEYTETALLSKSPIQKLPENELSYLAVIMLFICSTWLQPDIAAKLPPHSLHLTSAASYYKASLKASYTVPYMQYILRHLIFKKQMLSWNICFLPFFKSSFSHNQLQSCTSSMSNGLLSSRTTGQIVVSSSYTSSSYSTIISKNSE